MNSEEILRKHNLKNTGCRKHIINELLKHDIALSENEIKLALPDLFDRVTFYRSLKTLEEKEIIHHVILPDTTIKYALNKETFVEQEHAHFHCTDCDNVLCVENVLDENIHTPNGFTVNSVKVLLEGVCPSCKENKSNIK